ncbi:hypothetical protein SAMN05421847_1565 [Halpernia humi]|uniref:Uncharacterized protein n=1 Tax=Halpernia humi TaxID=493375 RepID=A0A1H5XVH1_9FLAO|nr:hypothetical protein SAMN05421847_1565 [Halpernia humi]
MKMEENKNKIFIFSKVALISFMVGFLANLIILLLIQKSEIRGMKDVLNSTLIIPYVIFITFKFYEIFISPFFRKGKGGN